MSSYKFKINTIHLLVENKSKPQTLRVTRRAIIFKKMILDQQYFLFEESTLLLEYKINFKVTKQLLYIYLFSLITKIPRDILRINMRDNERCCE